jgi:GxxExxY protein
MGAIESDPLTETIIAAALKVHSVLGPGLLESVYVVCLEHELRSRGLEVRRQVDMPVRFDDLVLEIGYRVDLLVAERVIVEVKSVQAFAAVHIAQVHTYLKLADLTVGLLLNFNVQHLRDGIRRVMVNERGG